MKKKLFLTLAITLAITFSSMSQLHLTVKPGFNINGLCVGLKKGSFTPFFTFQYASFNSIYDNTYSSGFSKGYTKGGLIMPGLGFKYSVKTSERISMYSAINFSIPFAYGKDSWENSSGGSGDSSLKEDLDKLFVMVSGFGIGGEYFLDEKFSIGGETTFIMGMMNSKENTDSGSTYIDKLKGGFINNSISLNFYF